MQQGDFEGLMVALREHPEWRDELRRELLTEELLALPAAVARLAAAQERTEARVEQLAAAQERTEAALTTLTSQVKRMDDDLGWVRGKMLEMDHRARAYTFFQRIARRIRVLEPQAIDDLFDDAIGRGLVTEREADDVRLADTLARGRRDGEPVYLVVESSFGVGPDDVARARRRADLLARIGVPTIAIVAGSWITPEAADAATAAAVWQVTERDGTVAAAA